MVKCAVILLSLLLVACAQPPGPVSGVHIERPRLPMITAEEAGQIPPKTWGKLVQRDLLRKQYAEKLEVIVQECTGGMTP